MRNGQKKSLRKSKSVIYKACCYFSIFLLLSKQPPSILHPLPLLCIVCISISGIYRIEQEDVFIMPNRSRYKIPKWGTPEIMDYSDRPDQPIGCSPTGTPCAPNCSPLCDPICPPPCTPSCPPSCKPFCAPSCRPRMSCEPSCRPSCYPTCQPRTKCQPYCTPSCRPTIY